MITYLDRIRFLYPNIQNVMQWQTDEEGNKLGYSGILWENKEIKKPTKEELDNIPTELVEMFLEEERKDALVESVRNDLQMKALYALAKQNNPGLTFRSYVLSINDMEIDR